jgi:hypothetical protein
MRKLSKEIDLGHGLFKYVEEEKSESEKMQEDLEPIWHDTQHDESDDIEAAKRQEADYTDGYWKREVGHLNNPSLIAREEEPEEVEWRIVELPNGGFIRRPFPVKEATLAGPDRPKRPWHFLKNEKWEWKK